MCKSWLTPDAAAGPTRGGKNGEKGVRVAVARAVRTADLEDLLQVAGLVLRVLQGLKRARPGRATRGGSLSLTLPNPAILTVTPLQGCILPPVKAI